jgi:hypothetical protein
MHRLLLLAAFACAPAAPTAATADPDPRLGMSELSGPAVRDALLRLPPDEQFGAAFAYGEGVGAHSGLSEIVARSRGLGPSLQAAYLDGAAHTWAPPRSVPPAEVARQIDRQVPWDHRRSFHRGVVISWSLAWRADPAQVVPAARVYGELVGDLPLDGVRIGLQRSLGHDLPAALDLAARYPAAWQPALVEELGWRAGDDAATWAAGLAPLTARVPEPQRCVFVHGAARGRVLRVPWSSEAEAADLARQLEARSAGCADAAWRGVAWALALTWDHRPHEMQHLASMLPEGPREHTLAQLQSLRGPGRGAPWELTAGRSMPGGRNGP